MRALIVVLDGAGAGAAPDSTLYGDAGANTLSHVAEAAGGLRLPVLERLGLGNAVRMKGVSPVPASAASYGRMRELSAGKDTITGHWEMMGIYNPAPFPTYPKGFPPRVISEFERRTGKKVLGNRAASGTVIIEELGGEHLRTGCPIVYTSADSVFQIAAHVDVIPVEELYEICRTAREILTAPDNVCRVIARPFAGATGNFTRISAKRKDFPLPPPEQTVLDMLAAKGVPVFSVGKVAEMFDMRGFTNGTIKTGGNVRGVEEIMKLLRMERTGLIFANLNDFDTLFGHRNDPMGFARALMEFDGLLDGLLPLLGGEDYLFITADHGNDPTTPGTDHSRELVPLLFFSKGKPGRDLGLREGFFDLGATVAEIFGVRSPRGESFLKNKNTLP